jgi:MFS family permease
MPGPARSESGASGARRCNGLRNSALPAGRYAGTVTSGPVSHDGPGAFTRDRLTFLVYGMATAFGFAVAAMGPAMPSMRDDLGMSRTVGGLHFTALAVGSVVSGFVVERLIRLWKRRLVFWLGGAGVATGSVLVGAGWHPAITLSGALLAGISGASMLTVSQATLSDHHPRHRSVALTEVNTAMSLGSVIPALLIGATLALGLGWRPAFLIPALILVGHSLAWHSEKFADGASVEGTIGRGRLPGAYWIYWLAFIPSVGAEWSLGAWGADYLVEVAGTTRGAASFLMTAFFGAMVTGRYLGSRVARRINPMPLLLGTTGVGLAGFLLFWSSTSVIPVVGGLLVAGLGISMQFPMILSLSMDAAAGRSDVAAARLNISAGGAVLLAPLTLGAIADKSGIRAAFGLVPALFFLVAILAIGGHRRTRPTMPIAPSPSV